MKKRIIPILLVLVVVLGMLPAAVLADDVIEVSDQAGLAAMENTAGNYRLTADITLENWTPFYPASGFTLDGNGHTITLTGTPLFEYIAGGDVIRNLIVAGAVNETGNKNTGALVRSCSGTIRNCASSADVTFGGSSPYCYVGGLAGKVTGTISNCLVTGTVSGGNAECYGAVSNIALFESAAIENCVAVGCDRIGSEEGFGAPTVITGTNCTLISDAANYHPEDYVEQFNANLQDGDLRWSVVDGVLAPRSSGGEAPEPDATEEELAALEAALTAADGVDTSRVYTAGSWESFCTARKNAEEIWNAEVRKQNKVVKAAKDLNDAIAALIERSLAAVDLSDKDVISITTADELEYMQAGKYYRLDADITLGTYWFGSFFTMDSVLDGNGHTITLNGGPLWASVGTNGVIQNLGILGTAQNSANDTGAIAQDCQGLIVNCWSRADVRSEGQNGLLKNTGGLIANLKSGGAIINCYVAGSVSAKGSTGTGVTGALAGTAAANTMIRNGYWLNTACDSVVGSRGGIVTDCAARTREEFYGDSFLNTLNAGRGEYGKIWTINDAGWPHLGEAGGFTPPQPVELTFTAYDGYGSGSTTFTDKQGLFLSLAEVLPDPGAEVNYYVGRFSLPGYSGEIEWQGQYVSDGQGNHKVFVSEDGELQVLGAGSLDIVAYDKNSWEVLAAFTVTVGEIQTEEIRLVPDGTYVTETAEGIYEVAGSGVVTLHPEILVDGVWKSAPSSLFRFEMDGSVFTTGGSTFYATEPGVITVTASGLGKTVSLTITSTYVPVTGIAPALGGTYVIHGRNANSDSLGDFLDLTLSHGAGTVIVEPENASYRDSWTLTSSDPEVAEYVQAFLRAVLPKKAGTVTLTAVSTDPNLTVPVTGTSVITLEYWNPLTEAGVDAAEGLTVRENETLVLPLIFTGSEGREEYHVTEPGMVWSFSGDGEVEIIRSPLGVIVGGEGSKEYCVANTEYRITGIQAGTVTVTGTPVDQTGGCQPITFTVTVEPGEPEIPADIDKIVSEGIAGAQNALQDALAGWQYQYGDEWAVFILTRSGQNLTDAEIRYYLDTVVQAYSAPKNAELKPTTIARVILAVSVLEQDASDLDGMDLVSLLCGSKLISDGSNEAAWALIALDSCDYGIPDGSLWNRETLIQTILKFQNPASGGFGLADNQSADIDITAMCIQALAPYYDSDSQVKAAVDAALAYLRTKMDRNCDFGSSESVSQVLIALTALGLDPLEEANGFVRSAARNLITGLNAYRTESGGFKHLLTDAGANNMASIQALQALVAYSRYQNKQTALYDLTGRQEPGTPTDPGTPGEQPATGEEFRAVLWIGLMTVSMLGIAMLLTCERRKITIR